MSTGESGRHPQHAAAASSDPSRYETQWDEYSRHWDSDPSYRQFEFLGDEWGDEGFIRWVIESFARPYLTTGQETVLELGPGGGRYTLYLVEAARRLFCVDVSSRMLARLSGRFASASHLVYWKNDGHDLAGLAADSIDFAFAWNVFPELVTEDVFGYLRELRRVLRPGGRAALHYATLGHAGGWQYFLDNHRAWARDPDRPGHFRSMTLGMMDLLASRAGLEVERNQPVHRDAVVIVRKPHLETMIGSEGAAGECRRDWRHLDGHLDVLAEDIYHEEATEHHTRAAREAVDTLLEGLPFESVLELGAGTAPTLDVLAARGKRTAAVSIGAELCRHPVLHRDVHFTGLPDESYDLIVARHVLEHSPMPLLLLMEMARIARRYALVVVPCDEQIWIDWPNHYSVFGKAMWRKLFDRAGWSVVEEVDGPLEPSSTEWRYLLEKPEREQRVPRKSSTGSAGVPPASTSRPLRTSRPTTPGKVH